MASSTPAAATAAVKALFSLIGRQSAKATARATTEQRAATLHGYLAKLDLEHAVQDLAVIHVAGSKGKGSTASMTERILREHGLHTGLYTSPHLIDVRERIRLNGRPVPIATFVDRFWHVWRKLGMDAWPDSAGPPPSYFCFLTLLAFDVFSRANVDVLVLETGLGGRLDATNVHHSPVATAITQLDLEHTNVLGDTLAQIAWEKAGIMKRGVPLVTAASQHPDAMEVLRQRSAELNAPLIVRGPEQLVHWTAASSALVAEAGVLDMLRSTLPLGLAGDFQYANAAIAAQLAQIFVERRHGESLSASLARETVQRGLQAVAWPGRAQQHCMTAAAVARCATARPGSGIEGTVTMPMSFSVEPAEQAGACTSCNSELSRPVLQLYIDGAHTPLSTASALAWYLKHSPASERALIFGCAADKDVLVLLLQLLREPWPRGVHVVPLGVCKQPLGGAPSAQDLVRQGLLHAGDELSAEHRVALQRAAAGAPAAILQPCASAREARWAEQLRTIAEWLAQAGAVPRHTVQVHDSLQTALLALAASSDDNDSVQHPLVTGSLHLAGSALHLSGWKA